MADSIAMPDVGTTLSNVPFGDLIKSAALAIADAQCEMDKSALRVAEMMSGSAILRDPETMLPIDVNGAKPMRSDAGVYYSSTDNSTKFEPAITDTRVFFGRELDGTPVRMSMLELGFTPTFYQFVETILEIKIALTLSGAIDNEVKNKGEIKEVSSSSSVSSYYSRNGSKYGSGFAASSQVRTKATPIDASYSTRYNYAVEASSLFRTKIVPVPPPGILEQRIRQQMQLDLDREHLSSLPVAALSITPTTPRIAAPNNSIKLAASALGPGGEVLFGRALTWQLVGDVPAGVTLANGVVTRPETSTRGTVSVKLTSELVEKTVTVELA